MLRDTEEARYMLSVRRLLENPVSVRLLIHEQKSARFLRVWIYFLNTSIKNAIQKSVNDVNCGENLEYWIIGLKFVFLCIF